MATICPRELICDKARAVIPMFEPDVKHSRVIFAKQGKQSNGIRFEFIADVAEVIAIPKNGEILPEDSNWGGLRCFRCLPHVRVHFDLFLN